MGEMQIFENPEFGSIRTVEIDGEPWLVGKDVAVALGYKNPQEAIRNHVDDEDKGVSEILTPGGKQQLPIINESGLYSLILSSKLPGAKKFKRWVTSEVLPSIRKTGSYIAPTAEQQTLADLTAAVQLLIERLDALEVSRASAPAPQMALPDGTGHQVPGIAAKKRWMRTVNEKLDLLSARKGLTHRKILIQTYQILEDRWGISLDEERLTMRWTWRCKVSDSQPATLLSQCVYDIISSNLFIIPNQQKNAKTLIFWDKYVTLHRHVHLIL